MGNGVFGQQINPVGSGPLEKRILESRYELVSIVNTVGIGCEKRVKGPGILLDRFAKPLPLCIISYGEYQYPILCDE